MALSTYMTSDFRPSLSVPDVPDGFGTDIKLLRKIFHYDLFSLLFQLVYADCVILCEFDYAVVHSKFLNSLSVLSLCVFYFLTKSEGQQRSRRQREEQKKETEKSKTRCKKKRRLRRGKREEKRRVWRAD